MALTQTPSGGPDDVPAQARTVPAEARTNLWPWIWTTVGLSVAFVTTAITTGLLARSERGEMEDYVRENSCDDCNGQPLIPYDETAKDIASKGHAYASVGNIFFGLSIAAVGTAGILLGMQFAADRTPETLETARVNGDKAGGITIAPWASAKDAGLMGRVEF